MDYALRQKLDSIQKKNVSLSISHSDPGSAKIIDDFKGNLLFIAHELLDNDLQFVFENNIKILIPDTSIVNLGSKELKISYHSKKRQKIFINLFSEYFTDNQLETKKKTPLVRDHYNSEGQLAKIIIDIAPGDLSREQLVLVKEFLTELLVDWSTLSVIRRKASSPVILHKNVKFLSVSEVDIPGESFLQIACSSNSDSKSIDIPTQFLVNFKQHKISFEFEGVSYEITRYL